MNKQIIFDVLMAAYGVALEEENGGTEPITAHVTSKEIEMALDELGVQWHGKKKI